MTNETPKAFATNQDIDQAVAMMQTNFEFGLHSRSSLGEVSEVVADLLADLGLPTRRSLVVLVARRSQLAWCGTVQRTKRKIRRGY